MQVTESIHVNEFGEFDQSCVCKNSDFFTVVKHNDTWVEIEPVEQWDAWACIACSRVINDKGEDIDHRKNVTFLEFA